jgi:hypothetical protein
MRLSQLAVIIEQADPDKIYVVGDSHAVAMGGNIPGAQVLAKNSATLQQIAAQAQSVPDGVRVLLTGGANDIASLHTAAGASVTKIIRGLKKRNCRVVYVSFPPIDLNGEFADVYREAGYTAQYNRVQQATANAARAELGSNNVSGLSMSDISPADPQAIHATPQAYSKIATGITQKFAKPAPKKDQSQDTLTSNLQLDLSKVPAEDLPYLDADGDGIVTIADAQAIGLPTESFSSYSGDSYGLFGILTNFTNSNRPIDPNAPSYKQWMQDAKARGLPPKPQQSIRGGSTQNANAALSFFKSKGYSEEQSAGIVGNLQAESGLQINPAAIGDGGKAWGIAQWHPDRRAIWEKATGKKWQSDGSSPNFAEQLSFIIYELQRTESRANKRLRATDTAEDAAAVFDQYYERSSGQARQKRIQLAQALVGSSTQTADASGVPTNGNPLFGLDGNQSRMTKKDAADQMAKTLARYKRMVAALDFPVRVNDAIAKAGTSRERQTPGSQHFHGTALDLSIAGLSQEQVKKLLVAAKSVGFTGFGFGDSILHVDSGPKRTWDYGNRDFAGLDLQSVKNWATA